MTPDLLIALLNSLPCAASLPPVETPEALLRALEEHADRAGMSPSIRSALEATHGWLHADQGIPPVVSTVRRGPLVRWSHWSASFDGTDTTTGKPVRMRTLRSEYASSAFHRRLLLREGAILQSALPHLEVQLHEDARPMLTAALAGPPVQPAEGDDHDDRSTWGIRMLGTGLAELLRWRRAGLSPAQLGHRDFRDAEDRIKIVCLSFQNQPENTGNLPFLAHTIQGVIGEGPLCCIDPLLEGIVDFPQSDVFDIAERYRATLGETLTGMRHEVLTRLGGSTQRHRLKRLQALVNRLHQFQNPPQGRGAVGVDLDGQTTLVIADAHQVCWGPAPSVNSEIWSDRRGLSVRETRRLLRAYGVAPPSPRLDRQVGGDPRFVSNLCRWLHASLELRTLHLLLSLPE